MFERMGENPASGDYIQPGAGDVWAFIKEMKKWLVDERPSWHTGVAGALIGRRQLAALPLLVNLSLAVA
jgi:hypothetical protein